MSDKAVWQILVPCKSNDGKPFRTRFHKVWDSKVKEISGGLTIHSPTKGKWISPAGETYEERMIPVTFIATKEEAETVVDYTLKYYDQLAILCYRISTDFILKHKDG